MSASSTKAKENANPQVFNVESERAHTRKGARLHWSDLGDFNQGLPFSSNPYLKEDSMTLSSFRGSSSISNNVVPTTPQDKAILLALMDCSMASTDGKEVALLRSAGLSIPSPTSAARNRNNPVLFQFVANTNDDGRDKNTYVGAKMGRDTEKDVGVANGTQQLKDSSTKSSTTTKSSDKGSPIDADEIFDIIRNIQDPEHPHSLEQLGVVSREQVDIQVLDDNEMDGTNNDCTLNVVQVRFTPTIPHCSMATLIGLCIKVKLLRSLGTQTSKYKVNVQIEPGTHASEKAINKQLRDKERVCAALENKHLASVVNKCIKSGAY